MQKRRLPEFDITKAIALNAVITFPLFCMHLVELSIISWDMVTGACIRADITPWVGAFFLQVVAIAVLCVALRFAPRPVLGAF